MNKKEYVYRTDGTIGEYPVGQCLDVTYMAYDKFNPDHARARMEYLIYILQLDVEDLQWQIDDMKEKSLFFYVKKLFNVLICKLNGGK